MRQVTVVDDEPTSLDVLVRAAKLQDFETQAARTAEEALELLEKEPTPIVVTDLRMPGKGGVWLCREIQKRWPAVSIIVITAGHDPDDIQKCLEAGAHHCLLKPVRFDDYHQALDTHLRNYHLRRDLEVKLTRRATRQQTTFQAAIRSLVRTQAAHDIEISRHCQRVRRLVLRFAEVLRLTPNQRRRLSLAARLHDIGKVGLSPAILHKPTPLTEDEFRLVREHPALGERILQPILRDRDILAAIRGHHERFDGQGYPDGLEGHDIPVLARILKLADCFDALTSERAYRPAQSTADALAELRSGAGSQFDPRLVARFESMFR